MKEELKEKIKYEDDMRKFLEEKRLRTMTESITQEELKKINQEHVKWLESYGRVGKRAILAYKDCSNLDFSNMNFRSADLKYMKAHNCNFTSTIFADADLIGVEWYFSKLNNAIFVNSNIRGGAFGGCELWATYFEHR